MPLSKKQRVSKKQKGGNKNTSSTTSRNDKLIEKILTLKSIQAKYRNLLKNCNNKLNYIYEHNPEIVEDADAYDSILT